MISVVIPVYNSAKFINQAVESALIQPEVGEVLLVEDGSQDNSLEICLEAERNNDRIRVLQHEGGINRGCAASRNLGIINAHFPYIAFLDADDYYLPSRFEKSMQILEENPEVDAVYERVDVNFETAECERNWKEYYQSSLIHVKSEIPPERTSNVKSKQGSVLGWKHMNGTTVRWKFLIEVGMFLNELRLLQGAHLWWRMEAVGNCVAGMTDHPVAVYQRHSDNRWSPWALLDNEGEQNNYQLIKFSHLYKWVKKRRLKTSYILHVVRELLWHRLVACKLQHKRFHRFYSILELGKVTVKYPEALVLKLFWRILVRQFVPEVIIKAVKS